MCRHKTELCRCRINLFHPILARRGPCSSFCKHLPLLVGQPRRYSLPSPGDYLRHSTRFILPCRISFFGPPISLALVPSAVGEVWEEDDAEEAVVGVAEEDMVAEAMGGNR